MTSNKEVEVVIAANTVEAFHDPGGVEDDAGDGVEPGGPGQGQLRGPQPAL